MLKSHKRISAAVLSLTLGFTIAGAPALSPIVSAQTSISAGNASTVDLNQDVSLTINKYQGLPVTDPADFSNLPRLDAEFTIQKIALSSPLDTLAGWSELAGIDPETAPIDSNFTAITVNTGATGSVTVSTATNPEFGVGAYLVTESPLAGHNVVAPFLVTLPFTDSATNSWNYDQVVHPKNQVDIAVDKDVVDLGATLGSTLSYIISFPVPAGNLTSLQVVDDLPGELNPAVNVTVATKTDAAAGPVPFALTDSTISATGGDGNELTVDFGAADRAALQALKVNNPGLILTLSFEAVISSLPEDSVIINHAIVNLPGGLSYSTDDPTDPDDGAQTRLGDLIIRNVDSATPPNVITAGTAVYELWRCQANGNGGFEVISQVAASTSPTGPAANTFSTTDGTITLYGVQAIDWVNGQAPTPEVGQDLCVVEISAPKGYELNPEPTQVSYVEPRVGYNMEADVIHLASDDVITLPTTGGAGTMVLIASGVLVALLGGAAAVRGNRARNN